MGIALATFADELRAALPFEALQFGPVEEAPRTFRSMAEARAALRTGLAGALAAARELGDTSLPDAIPVALAMLDAPGPLDRMALSPVMETIHQRLAALFRAEGERAGPEHGDQWFGLAAKVDADKALFTEWLERGGESASN